MEEWGGFNTCSLTFSSFLHSTQRNDFLNWLDTHHMNLIEYFFHAKEVDNNIYRPSTFLYRYIDWTFRAGFTSVFITFSFYYFLWCVSRWMISEPTIIYAVQISY